MTLIQKERFLITLKRGLRCIANAGVSNAGESGKPTGYHNYETKDYDGICEFIGT